MVYGLTTGQVSPTAAKGFKAKSTPDGVIDQPINPIALAIVSGATFVARGFAGDQKHLQELIVRGMQHNGFSVIDVFQPCVTFNKVNTYSWFRERVKKLEDVNVALRQAQGDKEKEVKENTSVMLSLSKHDTSDKKAALEKAMSEDPLWIGVFHESDEPSYEQQVPQLEKETLVEKDISEVNISDLVKEFR
jgi:2-oxoglutarate ferredoxin oxidoreductase subunit beta